MDFEMVNKIKTEEIKTFLSGLNVTLQKEKIVARNFVTMDK